MLTPSPGLTTEPLKMLHVATGGLTPAAVWLQKLPTWRPVVVSLIATVVIWVRSVPLANVIVAWLPAAPASPPVDDVLNPTL